ncbi:MAG: Flp family type IVb pilin [Planctomycetia bacterium]|nr:Flp family type IVb pilin [Planctomycetia bacterium]
MLSAIRERLVNFLKKEDGPTAVEYAVMLALIIVICLAAVQLLGQNSSKLFQTVAQSIGSTS